MKIVQVWVEYTHLQLDHPFTYACFDDNVMRGQRVLIEFNHREIIGFIEQVEESDYSLEEASEHFGYKLGVILKILDQQPLINEELFALASYMGDTTVASRISCFQAMLPAKLKPLSNNQTIKTATWVKRSAVLAEGLTNKQQEILAQLEKEDHSLSSWRKLSVSITKALEAKQLAEHYQKEVSYVEEEVTFVEEPLILTSQQKKAKLEILDAYQTGILLHGVTGSGKTEVYLQLAKEIVDKQKQVLILVPEIALTPQMVKRVKARFQSGVAIYHSALNNQEKYEQFKRVKNNEVSIVVGTRSAVFMPFSDLGLIIVDEEHDSSYKQDVSPTYHCLDIALWRAKYHDCKCVLGSATPSLNSYARALKKVYHLVELKSRINETMPTVTLVDIKEEIKRHGNYILSKILIDKIQDRLNKREQVVLLLNRRGYSPTVRCKQCAEALMCPHCDIALSYHRSDQSMKCHTCNYTSSLVTSCKHCGNDSFQFIGVGTQRLQEELQAVFKEARIARMDADTTTRKNAHQKILQRVEQREIDILVGTQIIAKGMDYPEVTLVGIINGDAGLNRPDFYSVESTFNLIVQASGRSGRSAKAGEVIIQAFELNHYAIQFGARQDYVGFFYKEMSYRHLTNNPPYSYLISLILTYSDQNKVQEQSNVLCDWLKQEGIKILGPQALTKIQDRYRYRIVLKGKNHEVMIKQVHWAVEQAKKHQFKCSIKVDTSPTRLE